MTSSQSVAAAVRHRLGELGWTQQELSERSRVSVATIRQVLNETGPGRRSQRTLEALSEALGWPRQHLAELGTSSSARAAADVQDRHEYDDFAGMTLAEVAGLAARASAEVLRRLRH